MMPTVLIDDTPTPLAGTLPRVGEPAPDFRLVFTRPEGASAPATINRLPKARIVGLQDYTHRPVLISVFPSIDTPVCADSVRAFEAHARSHPDHALLMVSADLPFALQRFCADNAIKNVFALSMIRDRAFARDYGVLIDDGPWAGLCARACFVVDRGGVIRHAQRADRLEQPADGAAALAALDAL